MDRNSISGDCVWYVPSLACCLAICRGTALQRCLPTLAAAGPNHDTQATPLAAPGNLIQAVPPLIASTSPSQSLHDLPIIVSEAGGANLACPVNQTEIADVLSRLQGRGGEDGLKASTASQTAGLNSLRSMILGGNTTGGFNRIFSFSSLTKFITLKQSMPDPAHHSSF